MKKTTEKKSAGHVAGHVAEHASEHVISHSVGHAVGLGSATSGIIGGLFSSSQLGERNEFSPEVQKQGDDYVRRTYGTAADGTPNRLWQKAPGEKIVVSLR